MDNETFDRLVRLLGTAGTRRAAVSALLGTGSLATAETALGRRKKKRKKKKSKYKNTRHAQNQTQAPPGDDGFIAEAADCANPGPSKNLKGCNFNGQNLAGFDLSGSNLRDAKFDGANLCGADLSSSTLVNADVRNAILTKTDMHSSACGGIKTNAGTTFCQTITCNGAVRSDDCPGADPALVCCFADDCAPRECNSVQCLNNRCDYTKQPPNQPGTLCDNPRVCCNGVCCDGERDCCGDTCIFRQSCCTNGIEGCPDGQKCCNDTCIDENRCCTNNVPDFCPPEASECCGGECIDPDQQCCKNDQPGCPTNETCLNTSETDGPTCCPDANICGLRCRSAPCDADTCLECDHSQSICVSFCESNQSCCGGGGVCKLETGQFCQSDNDCCSFNVCQGTPKVCCTEEGLLCSDDFECCGNLICEGSLCEEP